MEVMESEPFGPTHPIHTEVYWDLTDFGMITQTFEIIWSQIEQFILNFDLQQNWKNAIKILSRQTLLV